MGVTVWYTAHSFYQTPYVYLLRLRLQYQYSSHSTALSSGTPVLSRHTWRTNNGHSTSDIVS